MDIVPLDPEDLPIEQVTAVAPDINPIRRKYSA
jgi:hypothetical protein